MKKLHGDASATVRVTMGECLALVGAVDRYANWYPDVVRSAKILVMGEDGHPSQAEVVLHVSHGPLVRDFTILLSVVVAPPGMVTLTRIPHGPSDEEEFQVTWRVEERGATVLRLDVDASLDVPRFAPVGGIGSTLANGFVQAAVRALEPAR